MNQPVLINRLDAERLQRLIDEAADADLAVAEVLERHLINAEVVDPEDIPGNVVSMNSRVALTELGSDRRLVRTLVYPHSLAATEDAISVMAPLGAALLGRRVGEELEGPPVAGRPRRWRVEEILWQPEREGQFHR
ncbi:nucleoside diphosphate kinase regulator [Halomonas sp. V046]|uniref:nucleoside diphosphate kinase regulator n=1 Tax=Halomonas sp. V046 TaxID=3459611 RepID=UPI004044E434